MVVSHSLMGPIGEQLAPILLKKVNNFKKWQIVTKEFVIVMTCCIPSRAAHLRSLGITMIWPLRLFFRILNLNIHQLNRAKLYATSYDCQKWFSSCFAVLPKNCCPIGLEQIARLWDP